MKKVCLILLILCSIFCFGCDQKKVDPSNLGYDAAYNTQSGVIIQIGDSVELVNSKFDEEEYHYLDREDGMYVYEFRGNDGMIFSITFKDDQVRAFGIWPYDWAYGSNGVDMDMDMMKQELKSDWVFTGNITLFSTKAAVEDVLGLPSFGAGDEEGTYNSEYGFKEDFTQLTEEEYLSSNEEDTPAYHVDIMFIEGELMTYVLSTLF